MDITTIYLDPIRQLSPEGKAMLIDELIPAKHEGDLSYYRVKFLSDNFVCNRWVNKVRIVLYPSKSEQGSS
ncbi:hypothetical protein ACFL1Z_01620 [Thermodesulfobacteriota bacterium]